ADVDGAGQIRVEPAFELQRPSPDPGVADRGALLVAGVHQVVPLVVRPGGGGEGSEDGELVGPLREPGEVAGDLDAVDLGGDGPRLPLVLMPRFGVEGVEMRHAPVHVEVDDVLRRAGSLGETGGGAGAGGESEGADPEKGLGGALHEAAAA